MHGTLFADVAEEPFHIGGNGNVAARIILVGERQDQELHRRIPRHEGFQMRMQAALLVFERCVTEAMARGVRALSAHRQGCRAPGLAGSLVAQVDGFAAGILHRIVLPGGQPAGVRVLGPGVRAAAFGDHAAERRIGEDVAPWCRCLHALFEHDHVLASVVRIDAHRRTAVDRDVLHGTRPRGRLRGGGTRDEAMALHLLLQRSEAVHHHDAGTGFHHQTVFVRERLCRADEDTTGPVQQVRLGARGQQAGKGIVQGLTVSRAVLVPDHQVDGESTQAPVRRCTDEVAGDLEPREVTNAQQHDGQVARHRLPPEPGLPPRIGGDLRRLRPQREVGIEDGGRHVLEQLSIRESRIGLAQPHLAMRPRQVEHAIGKVPVAILVDEAHATLAGVGDAGHEVERRCLVRFERDAYTNGDDRIEHRAFAARQDIVARCQRHGLRRGAAATDEACAVGLVRNGIHVGVVHGHQMAQPWRTLVGRARTARAQQRLHGRHDLAGDEQLAESGMRRVTAGIGQDHFRVARQFDGTARASAIGDLRAAQFDVVFRRYDDLGVGFEAPLADAELGAGLAEDRLETLRLACDGLVRRAPYVTRRRVPDVAEHAVLVARDVFAPSRHGHAFAATVTTTGAAHHDVVTPVGKQLHRGARTIRIGEEPQPRLRHRGGGRGIAQAGGVQVLAGRPWQALLQQQARRHHGGVRLEALPHGLAQQRVADRQQRHTLVMGHVGLDDGDVLARRQARRRVVDGFVETEASRQSGDVEAMQVLGGRGGRHHQGEHRRVGCHHEIVAQAAFQSQSRHAERAVLVIHLRIDRVVARLGHAPRQSTLSTVFDLPRHRGATGLVEQAALVVRHDQHGHQVLEHGPGP